MPLPKTGSLRNWRAVVRNMGTTVTLADGSTIQGVFRVRTEDYALEPGSQIRTFTTLYLSEEALGTLAVGQDVVIDGTSYYVSSMNADSDGIVQCDLSLGDEDDGIG